MSREAFTIAYDGTALREGAMDVRDLAPALMALGQLFDAANRSLNGDAAVIKLQVKATEIGSFQIALELVQSWTSQILHFFETPEVSGATNLLAWVLGTSAIGGPSLLGLIKVFKGRPPDSVEKLPGNMMRLVIGSESYDVPLELLRLYQDVATRNALQKLIEEPLSKPGITSFAVKKDATIVTTVSQEEAVYFAKPRVPDEILVEEVRRSAFSIISLAFKEENKWRLYDGNTQISAAIEDEDFLQRVENNQVSFSKGDILICDVRVVQRRTLEGLRTDYVVERVVDHIPGARQLPLPLTKTHHDGP
jgi:hypothetical protein